MLVQSPNLNYRVFTTFLDATILVVIFVVLSGKSWTWQKDFYSGVCINSKTADSWPTCGHTHTHAAFCD